jgi:hypothetical protein
VIDINKQVKAIASFSQDIAIANKYKLIILMIQSKLLPQQLTDVITLVFKGAIFKILRIIKEAGRSRVVWIYLVDRYGKRRATFISVREMNIAFLNYLNQCDYATRIGKTKQNRLRSQEYFALSDAFALILKVGDMVFKVGRNEFGTVVEEFPLLLEIF